MKPESQPRLLLVDDDAIIAQSLEYVLQQDFDVVLAEDRLHAMERLAQYRQGPDLALVDLGLPPDIHKPDEGLKLVEYIAKHFRDCAVLVLSGQDNQKYIDQAQNKGAVDFISKPCDVAELKVRLQKQLQEGRDLESKVQGVIGESAAINLFKMQVQQLATSPYPVLIEGESGSGKELAAKNLHLCSERISAPFLTLNCAAFNGELLESQLFGHAKGAFTGAVEQRKGFFLKRLKAVRYYWMK